MQGTLKIPPGFSWQAASTSAPPVFRAWLCAPLDLKQGDEVEVDLPAARGIIRAAGRIVALAVHADGRLWYQFAAESTAAIIVGQENPEPRI